MPEDGVDNAEFQESLDQDGLGPAFQDRLRQLLTSDTAGRN